MTETAKERQPAPSTGPTVGTGAAQNRPQLVGAIVFWLCLAAAIAAMWTVEYLPLQDGPAHVGIVDAWAAYDGSEGQIYRQYMAENSHLAPNWSATIILRGLVVSLEPASAHTLLTSLIVIGTAVAAWYALGAAHAPGRSLAVLSVPLATNWYVFRGSFNFSLGIAVLLVIVGYWIRHGEDPTPRDGAVLALLLLLAYFSHPIPLLAAWLVLFVLVASATIGAGAASGRQRLERLLHTGRYPVLASVPALALFGFYLATNAGQDTMSWSVRNPIEWLLSTGSLVPILEAYSEAERIWVISLSVALLGLAGWALVSKTRSRSVNWRDGLLLGAVLLGVVSWLSPSGAAGGTSIMPRLALCAVFVLLVWLGTVAFPDPMRWFVIGVGAVISLGLTVQHLNAYQAYDAEIAAIVALGDEVEEGSTLLPVLLHEYLGPPYHRVMPPLYASSWIAIERESVDLGNLDPGTAYHPLRWRALDEDVFRRMLDHGPGDLRREADSSVADRADDEITYVLTIGPQDRMDSRLSEWLAEEYEVVEASRAEGMAQLYRLRD